MAKPVAVWYRTGNTVGVGVLQGGEGRDECGTNRLLGGMGGGW